MAVRIIARLFFLVAPLLLAACPSARAQPPNCAGLSVALHRLKKPVAMGQFVTIKARLRSFSATFPGRVVVQVSLPPGLCPAKTGVSPDPAKVAPSAATPEEALSAAGDSLFWIDVPVSPHRGGKKTRRFTIKAYASSSMTLGPHSVNASVYVLPSEGGGFVPRCLTQATSRTLTITAAAAASWKKAAAAAAYNCTWTPSPPSPSPAPANPGFEFYADHARCLEAELTPLRRLRELRQGSTFPTEDECYDYCAVEDGMVSPYYFFLDRYIDGNDCYCCQTCHQIYDPRTRIYVATVTATASPSTAPTPNPTPAPTTKSPTVAPTPTPTTAPTKQPSVAPTPSPTNQPSKTPTQSPTPSGTGTPTVSPTTASPTGVPTGPPTKQPTQPPSPRPTQAPTTAAPSPAPTVPQPTPSPTKKPTQSPTAVTDSPSLSPTGQPTLKQCSENFGCGGTPYQGAMATVQDCVTYCAGKAYATYEPSGQICACTDTCSLIRYADTEIYPVTASGCPTWSSQQCYENTACDGGVAIPNQASATDCVQACAQTAESRFANYNPTTTECECVEPFPPGGTISGNDASCTSSFRAGWNYYAICPCTSDNAWCPGGYPATGLDKCWTGFVCAYTNINNVKSLFAAGYTYATAQACADACAGGAVGGPAYFVFNPPNGGCACYYNEDCASNIAQAPVNTAELYAFNGASCMPPGR